MKIAIERIQGGSFTLSKRPKAFPSGVWAQAWKGEGPYVFDTHGRKRLDWMCALGALPVGHTHPKIVEAVTNQMKSGAIFSLPHMLEARVAMKLCEVIPCAESVRVVKTGSEACSAAMRIARMATGRELILTTETSYHGWHDVAIAAKPKRPGVPAALDWTINTFRYNDLVDFEERVAAYKALGKQLAAVMLEPVQGEPPQNNFLHDLVAAAHRHGALVIFDEMLCGGRLKVGGAQEYYGVTPDLATFGKALGGGLPFAFVCGRDDLMQHAWPISGTFSGDALALAAADVMLDLYADPSEAVIMRMWRNGEIAREALMQVATRHDLALKFFGHSPRFWFEFPAGVDQRLAKSVFVQQASERGQLVHPVVIFASAAMTTAQATEGAAAMAGALDVTCEAIKDGSLAIRLVGDPYEDSVR